VKRRFIVVVTSLLFLSVAPMSAWASVGPKWTDDQLVNFSAAIVTGRVADLAVGRDPQTDAIYTYVTVAIDQVLKGEISEREIVVKQLGGRIGDQGLVVNGQAVFAMGETVLLYLEVRPRDATLYTSALWQGKWNIERDATTGDLIALRADPHDGNRGPFTGDLERRAAAPLLNRLRALGAIAASPNATDRGFVAVPSADELKSAVHTSLLAEPYTLLGPWRWNEADTRTAIPVDIQAAGQPGVAGGGVNEVIRAANIWTAVTPLTLTGAGNGTYCQSNPPSGHISVSYDDPCGEISNSGGIVAFGGAYYSFSGGKSVNGVSFARAVAGFFVTNDGASARAFLANSGCLQTTETHELGHVFGLGHSGDPNAIMYPIISNLCFSGPRSLNGDDIAGIQSIYPGGGVTPPSAAPGPPSGLTASSAGSTITLSWARPSSGGAPSAYTVEAGSVSGAANLANFSTGNAATTFSSSGVGGGNYYVRVRATNAAGTSAPSNEALLVVGNTGCAGAPGAPGGLAVVSVSGGTVVLSWNAASGSPTTYIVEAGSVPGLTNLANSDLGGTATRFTASGVGRGTYYVRVRAKNNCGTGAASNEVLLTVP
jgi:hypothetical protein